jgi:hypothetical protein
MPEEKPTIESVHLPTGGPVAGIPNSHVGPGAYIIDWLARTITPIVQVVEAEIAHIEEAIHPADEAVPAEVPAPAEEVPIEPAPVVLEQVSELANQEP